MKDAEGKDWAGEYSFLVDPALFTETFKLEYYIDNPTVDVSSELYEGFSGSWKFGSKKKGNDKRGKRRDGVTSTRFLPKASISTKEDFRFEKGSVNVYTYLTSRSASQETT